jgi:hypothetical protein
MVPFYFNRAWEGESAVNRCNSEYITYNDEIVDDTAATAGDDKVRTRTVDGTAAHVVVATRATTDGTIAAIIIG